MYITLLFSGGNDSTFSLFFLKKLGHIVKCKYIKICMDQHKSYSELSNCLSLCKKLSSKFEIENLVNEYKKNVFEKMICDYKKGKTPNPDILCNKEIKFGKHIFNKKKIFCSGHYTKKISNNISIPLDFKKDQTYFLNLIKEKVIKKFIFPLGVFYRKETEFIISFLNLKVNLRSRGICFLNIKNFKNFISKYITKKCYIIYNNCIIAKKRIYYKTIRQKIFVENKGIFYINKKKKEKLYVVKKNNILLKKRIFLSKKFYFSKLYKVMLSAKIFSSSELFNCFLLKKKKYLKVIFVKPVFNVSKGQYISFFKNNVLVGYVVI
ncbi:aminomethyltransferase beta-barrel domain-containing protein [Candidatus Vidania fulgoroideorum]